MSSSVVALDIDLDTRPDRDARALLALSLVLASLLLIPALRTSLWGSEGRWLVVAREMARSGDALTMVLGDDEYAAKPFGSYWLVIGAAKLLGGFTEVAGRLPGVVAYVATLIVTYVLGCRTLGARTGALAALLLAASARMLVLAGTASADPQQLLGLTVALLLLLEAFESGRLRDFLLLGVVAGLTTQMKGLPGLALPGFAAVLWALLVRGPRWLVQGGALLGALTGLALAFAPYLVARGVHGDWNALGMLWHESVLRALEPFDHVEPWWFYLSNQFVLLTAWSMLLPAALMYAGRRLRSPESDEWGWWQRLRASEPMRRAAFPLFAYLAVLLFFGLSASRRSYYLMPIAPFAALLVADVLLAAPAGLTGLLRRSGLGLLGVSSLALGLLTLTYFAVRPWITVAPASLTALLPDLEPLWPRLPVRLVATALAILPAVALLRASLTPRMLVVCVGATLAQLALLSIFMTMHLRSDLDPLPRFAAAVRAIAPPAELAGLEEASGSRLRFYLDPPPGPQPSAPRFRIVSADRLSAVLAAEPEWRRVDSPLLDAAAWPAGESKGYTLLERRTAP